MLVVGGNWVKDTQDLCMLFFFNCMKIHHHVKIKVYIEKSLYILCLGRFTHPDSSFQRNNQRIQQQINPLSVYRVYGESVLFLVLIICVFLLCFLVWSVLTTSVCFRPFSDFLQYYHCKCHLENNQRYAQQS